MEEIHSYDFKTTPVRFGTMTVTLVDGNNYFRRIIEARSSPLRAVFSYSMYLPTHTPMIWIWDGAGAVAARRKIFPGYKLNRKKPDPSFYEFQDLAKEIIKLSEAVSIEVPEFEADDVIATIVRTNPKVEFHINTNDGDMGQLIRSGVTTDIQKLKEDPKWLRLYKTFVGDPSDKIPGAKGFGDGTWKKLKEDHKYKLLKYIKSSDPALLNDIPIGRAGMNWLFSPKNLEQICKFYSIIGFLNVSEKLIAKHSVAGKRKPLVVNQILEDLFQ